MIRFVVVCGYLLVPLAGAALVLAAWRWPARIAGLVGLAQEMEPRAARATLLLFVWWVGWHFLVGSRPRRITSRDRAAAAPATG
ncbi:MAG: DUF6186 family protein [Actinomycetales bacterium]